jgi:Uncharacterized conserved protein (DUF2304).
MSIQFRILLIALTGLCFLVLIKNVKKGNMRSDYAVVWILCSFTLLLLSIFPQIADFFASQLGIISTANMVFAIIIFLLIIMVYLLFTKVSWLEEKQKAIVQELAILNKRLEDEKKSKITKR